MATENTTEALRGNSSNNIHSNGLVDKDDEDWRESFRGILDEAIEKFDSYASLDDPGLDSEDWFGVGSDAFIADEFGELKELQQQQQQQQQQQAPAPVPVPSTPPTAPVRAVVVSSAARSTPTNNIAPTTKNTWCGGAAQTNLANAAVTANAEKDAEASKPKRPLSAYNLFFQLERERLIAGVPEDTPFTADDVERIAIQRRKLQEEGAPKRKHRKSHGKISFAELARKIANKWKILEPDAKDLLQERAAIEKARYLRELEEWTKDTNKAAAVAMDNMNNANSMNISNCNSGSSNTSHVGFEEQPMTPNRYNQETVSTRNFVTPTSNDPRQIWNETVMMKRNHHATTYAGTGMRMESVISGPSFNNKRSRYNSMNIPNSPSGSRSVCSLGSNRNNNNAFDGMMNSNNGGNMSSPGSSRSVSSANYEMANNMPTYEASANSNNNNGVNMQSFAAMRARRGGKAMTAEEAFAMAERTGWDPSAIMMLFQQMQVQESSNNVSTNSNNCRGGGDFNMQVQPPPMPQPVTFRKSNGNSNHFEMLRQNSCGSMMSIQEIAEEFPETADVSKEQYLRRQSMGQQQQQIIMEEPQQQQQQQHHEEISFIPNDQEAMYGSRDMEMLLSNLEQDF